MIQNGSSLFIQMIAYISLGGFLGEVIRAHRSTGGVSGISPVGFILNMIVGGFLGYILASIFYNLTENRGITLGICGLLGYQEVEILEKIGYKKIMAVFGIEVDKDWTILIKREGIYQCYLLY